MQYRPLGKTGLSVSEIGFGAWGIGGGGSGWVGADEDESFRALHRAIELGINFVDTARGYSESERICGRVLREHPREQVYVATKVAPKNRLWPAPAGLDPMDVFPGEHIRSSVETSLRESGLESFDVLQLHVWSDDWVGRGDWLETVDDLRAAGKIRFFGISVNDYQPENAVRVIGTGVIDTVQVIYNVFHQAPQETLLPLCEESGVGVIVRVALDEGGLTGRIRAGATFPSGDFRATFFGGDRAAQVEAHVDALVSELGITQGEVADIARA